MRHNLGFVFTNYNNSNDTVNAIKSIKNITLTDNPIIVVVDNNSNAVNIDILKKLNYEFKDLCLILNKVNLGYFGGLNIGIKFIKENYEIKYLVIGNNDLIFPTNFFNTIISKEDVFFKYPVISPNIITEDGIHQNPHVIKKISKFREFIYDIYFTNYFVAKIISKISHFTRIVTDRSDEIEYKKSQIIYQGHGSCYILTPIFFKNFNQLFAPTFLMGEEFFLSYQLKEVHQNIYYEYEVQVTHKCHASINNIPRREIWEISKKSHVIYRKYLKKYNKLNFQDE